MHFASKNVLAVLFAAGALLASILPEAQAYSPAENKPNTQTVESYAWVESCSIKDTKLNNLEDYIPDLKLSSYNQNLVVLNDMRLSKPADKKLDKANYAVEKVAFQYPTASTEAKIETPIIKTEVKADVIEITEDYSLNADILLGLINEHRVKIGIPALIKDDRLMQIAVARTPQLFDEIFVNGNMHAGFRALNLPYFATENIIYNRTEIGAFNWWLNSGVHRAAIQNPEHTHTGIACSGKACAQIFSAFKERI